MRYLKTNTATVIIVGPFLDPADGVTPEVSLTVTNSHLTFVVDNAGTPTLAVDADATASGGNNDMVHLTNDDGGMYTIELAAANVNYLGGAILTITDPDGHCPVFHEFTILPAQVYDSLIAGSDLLDANASQAGGTAWGSAAITAATIATGAITNAKFAAGAIDAAAVADGAIDAGAIATGTITNAKFAAGAIDAAAIAQNAIDADSLAADAGTEIATAVWATATRVLTANTNLNDPTTAAIADAVWDEVVNSGHATANSAAVDLVAILGDTNELQVDNVDGGRTDLLIDGIKTKTDYLPSATAGNAGGVFIAGTNAATTITTALTANITGNITGNLSGSVGTLTTNTPTIDDTAANHIADHVWDEALSGHATGGSAGAALSAATAPTAAANADAVWDELLSGHTGAGSAGLALATASSGGVDPSVLADAIWDEATSGHQTAGTTGLALTAANNGTPPTAAAIADAVLDEAAAGHTGLIPTNLDAAITSRLAPTVAARTLDVSATGEAGLDFDNIKDATGAHTLTNITVPVVTSTATATNLTNAPANGDFTATMKTSLNTATPAVTVSDKTGFALSAGGVTAVQSGLSTLTAGQVNAEMVDVLRTDTIPDSYSADGAQPTFAQAVLEIRQMLMEKSIAGVTMTVKKPDGSTTAMTFTLNSATEPTAITRAA